MHLKTTNVKSSNYLEKIIFNLFRMQFFFKEYLLFPWNNLTYKNDTVKPPFSVSVEMQIALSRWQDE